MALIKWKQISSQLGNYGNLTGSLNISGSITVNGSEVGTNTGSFAVTASNHFTGSQFFTGSLIPEALDSENGIHDLGSLSKPWKDLYLTTGSLRFVKDGQLVSQVSGEPNAIRVGNVLITTASLAFINDDGGVVQNIATAERSGSTVVASEQVLLPDGVVSSSAQINLAQAFNTASHAISASYALSASHEITYELSSSHAVQADTASFISDIFISESAVRSGFGSGVDSSTFNGNRVISQIHLPGFFTSSFNPGTSGSISDFLEKIFYPNTAPSFTSNANVNVAEFLDSGSSIHTLTATDPEGQNITFSAQASYTDGLVNVASDGAVTLLTASTTELFNTVDRGDGTDAHLVPVRATDSFSASIDQNLYLTVIANSAPVFRETSTGGSIITSFTTARNENASTGEVTKIYFTDANSDAITIRSSSVPGDHFTITKYGTYVSIAQATASLDFETTSSYSFSISASDEHYESGEDADSITTLPITINVTDNVIPTVNNQTFTGFSEDENDGDSSKQIAASDPEGDTIVFNRFELAGLEIDGSEVSIGTYGGTSQSDPHEDPFTMNNSGLIERKSSQFINSDLINAYIYSASVTDNFNTTSASAAMRIEIDDDVAPTLSGIQAFYVIESAISGASIYDSTNGFSGTTAQVTSNQSPTTFEVNPSSDFAISSTGLLTINRDISGSSDVGGGTLQGSVTGSNSFGTPTSQTFTVNITDNVGPTVTTTPRSTHLNTNGARVGNYIYQFSFSDTEGDSIDRETITWTSTAPLSASFVNTTTLRIFPTASVLAGTYTYTGSIQDDKGFETTTFQDSFTIAQAPIGSLTTNGTFRIIESAVSGDNIVLNTNGRTGTQGDLGVSYSPNYNSAAVQNFTSSNAAIAVATNGNLTIGLNLSGSATSSGDTINSDITYRDQYGNIGSGSITVNVTPNIAPFASFTNAVSNLTASVFPDTELVSITITDDESDTPFSMSLTGDVENLKAVAQNANSSSYQIQNINRIYSGSTYNYTASIFDNFDESRVYSQSFDIRDQLGLTYIYGWQNTSPSSEATFLAAASGDTSGTPVTSGSVIGHFQSGSIGSSSFTPTYVGNKVTLYESGALFDLSGSNGVEGFGNIDFSNTGSILMIVFPSQSLVQSKPQSMYDGTLPDNTDNVQEYYLYADNLVGIDGVTNSGVYYFDTQDFVEGHKRWGMVFAEQFNNNNATYLIIADEQTYSS